MPKSVVWLAAALTLAAAGGVPRLARADPAPPVLLLAPVATGPDAASDPVQMAAARRVVDHVFPAGTYARLMNGAMTGMMAKTVDSLSQMPLSAFAGAGGVSPDAAARLDKATMGDVMAILDPAFQQRSEITVSVMMSEMTSLMAQVEPGIRDGLAEAYARRFSADQLADMNRFFETPSGAAFASNVMLLQADPAVVARMQAFMPMFIKALPGMVADAQRATASLPKPRRPQDLSPAERARLARLLGAQSGAPKAH